MSSMGCGYKYKVKIVCVITTTIILICVMKWNKNILQGAILKESSSGKNTRPERELPGKGNYLKSFSENDNKYNYDHMEEKWLENTQWSHISEKLFSTRGVSGKDSRIHHDGDLKPMKAKHNVNSNMGTNRNYNNESNVDQYMEQIVEQMMANKRSSVSLQKYNKDISKNQERLNLKRFSNVEKGSTFKRFPQALLFGVKKCGTGTFKQYLQINKHVRVRPGEAHFFDDDDHYNKGMRWYLRSMPASTPGQLTLEGSPKYFVSRKVPDRVKKMNSTILLMAIFKDPAKRLISDYTHERSMFVGKHRGKQYPAFQDAVFYPNGSVNSSYEPVKVGIYVQHLKHWLKYFPWKQIHIINGDNFIKNPATELQSAEDFLKVRSVITSADFMFDEEKGYFCQNVRGQPKCMGKNKGRDSQHPDVPDDQMAKIRDFYRPYNEQFYELVGQKFNWS